MEHPKFAKAGLVVGLNQEHNTRITLVNMHSQITPNEFMQNLYSKKLNDMISLVAFEKDIKMVSKLWVVSEKSVMVTLGMPEDAVNAFH